MSCDGEFLLAFMASGPAIAMYFGTLKVHAAPSRKSTADPSCGRAGRGRVAIGLGVLLRRLTGKAAITMVRDGKVVLIATGVFGAVLLPVVVIGAALRLASRALLGQADASGS